MLNFNRSTLIHVLCGILLSACAATPATPRATSVAAQAAQQNATASAARLAFEIIEENASLTGAGDQPITLAVRGGERAPAILDDLPAEAKATLDTQLTQRNSDLYIIIYTGPVGSGGYQVKINSITTQQQNGREQLIVDYSLQGPPPGSGAAAVITYPYAIARVRDVGVKASDVVFEQH